MELPRKRPFIPRVKTGCITCKIRRVKCDETKPACNRCTSTGRTCDGYAIIPARSPKPLDAPKTILPPSQHRSLEFFLDHVSPCISTLLEDDAFWKRLVLQSNHPAIQNAVFAVSNVFEQVEKTNGRHVPDNSPFATQSYSLAIQHLVKPGQNHAYTTLLTCILFVCLEFMRGDIRAAQNHIQSGSSIVASLKSGAAEEELCFDLVTIFSRLRLQSALFNPDVCLPVDGPPGVLPAFDSIAQARQTMYATYRETKDLVFAASRSKYSDFIPLDQYGTQARIEADVRRWRSAYRKLYTAQNATWNQRQRDAANVLLMQNIVTEIQIATALDPNETANDAFRTEFETLIDLSTTVSNNAKDSLSFHFDMGLIPTLHYIGTKCRFPILRRQILRILGSRHWREGMFDSHRSFRYIVKVMEAEEAAMPSVTDFEMENILSRALFRDRLPPEEHRVHYAVLGRLEPHMTEQQLTMLFFPTHSHEGMYWQDEWIPTDGPLPDVEPWLD